MALYLDIASAICLFASAGLWLVASTIKVPFVKGALSLIGEPIEELSRSLARQSDWNKRAALAAALGVAFQAVAIVLRAAG